MSYQFGSFPAASGYSTAAPSFGAQYGGFSGFNSGFPTAASPFTTSGFGAAAQPAVYSQGFSQFGAQPAFSGNTFGAPTTGFGGLYSGVSAAPAAFGAPNAVFGAAPASFGAYPSSGFAQSGFPQSGFAQSGFSQVAPTAFGGFQAQPFGGLPSFATPDGLAQNAFLAQAQAQAQQGDAQARGRQVSKIEYGLGVPTMIPASGNEEKLERTPSGNLPRREASRGELRTRSFSGQPASPLQGAPNSMAAYLAQNSSLGAGRAQAVAASTMSPRNLGAPTGHRGSNPREQVPW